MKTNPTPHDYIRDAVTFWIGLPAILLIIALIVLVCSCSPKYGCPSHSGKNRMSGYGWLKCNETNKVCILDKDGAIICTYIDKK